MRVALLAWQPFDRSDYRVWAVPGGYQVAAWDGDAVDSALQAAGWAVTESVLWPETVLREPLPSGLHLIAAMHGYEGQCWQDAKLVQSRWWPDRPEAADWETFARSIPLGRPLQAMPPLEDPAWLTKPWADPKPMAAWRGGRSRIEVLTVNVACLGFIGLTAAQFHWSWQAWEGLDRSRASLDALRTTTKPTAGLREQTTRDAENLDKRLQGLDGLRPLEVLVHLDELLPAGVVLKSLDLNGLQLKMDVETPPALSRTQLLASLQRSLWITDVGEGKPGSQPNLITLDTRLRGTEAPVPAVRNVPVASPGGASAPPSAMAAQQLGRS